MQHADATVFVVDDDLAARESVAAIVESMGLSTHSFASAEELLTFNDLDRHGCIVSDVRMMSMSGLELQLRLKESRCPLPMIIITGYADVPLAVTAMQNGAVTVLEKPCRDHELWDAIRRALDLDLEHREARRLVREMEERLSTLTPDERIVLERIVDGDSNKAIAYELDVSVRTVETRRKQVFEKMRVENLGELIRLINQNNAMGIR